jgi:hypothetical protein
MEEVSVLHPKIVQDVTPSVVGIPQSQEQLKIILDFATIQRTFDMGTLS